MLARRIETARSLLETTQLSVEQIAREVGYAEPSTLRRVIWRDTRHSPRQQESLRFTAEPD
ncbi:helix-turn-helix domain-containing protein [Bradyrhizobium sp. AS23.2]|uniref:helix-turn-helix domain-containing protein n=1 Tax=Bradyrhizobium sp. AS23.2 TaxID=1680155 RepID=UPI00093AF6C2|nr:helix-turn-helix domain-containing protein [Bradyrhizobium sp. AS23.2]OKO87177.1 hypothetical protein AC630_01085 [Bradyrhizobium sp. AS23.2]